MWHLQVENSVVGFAGGLTDHIVSSVGRENELLGIDCSSNEIEARIPLPRGLRFWAVDSGSFHGTEGEQYSTIRAAAFMGLRYLEEASDVLSPFMSSLFSSEPCILHPIFFFRIASETESARD